MPLFLDRGLDEVSTRLTIYREAEFLLSLWSFVIVILLFSAVHNSRKRVTFGGYVSPIEGSRRLVRTQ